MKLQLLFFSLLATFPISCLQADDTFARISDQVVYPPDDLESIRTGFVVRIVKVDGKDPVREAKDLKGTPPYVLLEEGTHLLKVTKSRVFGDPEEDLKPEFIECFVKAGLIYELRHTDEGIKLEERKEKA